MLQLASVGIMRNPTKTNGHLTLPAESMLVEPGTGIYMRVDQR